MIPDAWLIGRRGQTLAVAIGLIAISIVWFGAITPIRTWFDDRQIMLQQRQELLQHMRVLAESLPALRAAAADKHDNGAAAAATAIPGSSDSIAAADLQERVQVMASAAGASLTAVETLPASNVGDWHKVSLRISLNAPWQVLMELMSSIEGSPARIFIDDIHFHSPVVIIHGKIVPIQATMVLYGFRHATPGAGA